MAYRERRQVKTELARELRRRQTPAEARLWRLLRDRRLAGYKFRRQYPVGRFVLDFYCPAARLGLELDGGGHNCPERSARDLQRSRALSRVGIRVVRFWNHDVLERPEAVLRDIVRALLARSTPSP